MKQEKITIETEVVRVYDPKQVSGKGYKLHTRYSYIVRRTNTKYPAELLVSIWNSEIGKELKVGDLIRSDVDIKGKIFKDTYRNYITFYNVSKVNPPAEDLVTKVGILESNDAPF